MGLGVSVYSNLFVNHASCIPSLSCLPFYHPYMPFFFIRRIFNLLVILTLCYVTVMHLRCLCACARISKRTPPLRAAGPRGGGCRPTVQLSVYGIVSLHLSSLLGIGDPADQLACIITWTSVWQHCLKCQR